ncbi:MAG: hypothetical protein ACPG85_06005, partial [Flavobacteriales bacterium]
MTIPFDTRILKFALAGGALAYAVQLYSTGYIGSGIGMTLIGLILGVTALRSIRMILVDPAAEAGQGPRHPRWHQSEAPLEEQPRTVLVPQGQPAARVQPVGSGEGLPSRPRHRNEAGRREGGGHAQSRCNPEL